MSSVHEGVLTPHVMRRLLRQQVYFAVLFGAVIWFLYSARHVVPLFIFAFLLAYILAPVVGFLSRDAGERYGVPRTAAILSVYALILGGLSAGVWLLTGKVARELRNLSTNFPSLRADMITRIHQSEHSFPLDKLPESVKISIDNTINNLDKVVGDEVHRLAPSVVQQVPGLLELLVIPILAYYLLKDGAEFIRVPRSLMHAEHRARYDHLVAEINESLRGYLKGQITLSLIAAAAVFILLTAFGIHYAYLVAITAFFLELVPVVGPLVWATEAVLLTWLQKPQDVIFVLILVIVAHQSDMHIIGPKILGSHLRLHPAVIIMALVAGTTVFGLLGALLAAPVAALLNIIVKYLMTEGALSPAAVDEDDLGTVPPPVVGSRGAARASRPGRKRPS